MNHFINFTKMHSLGNDFVVIDNIKQQIYMTPLLVQQISNRRLGIGCDQVLLIEPPMSATTDFFYRIYNADGNEVEHCGNGARCIARFVRDNGLCSKDTILFGTIARELPVTLESNERITVSMGLPVFENKDLPVENKDGLLPLMLEGKNKEVRVLSIGNPHCIIKVSNLQEAHVESIGQSLQNHPDFPNGVNVSFVQTLARNHIQIRVYERGAAETTACGTGATASVISGILDGDLSHEVLVEQAGGRVTVQWDQKTSAKLIGPANSVFHGQFYFHDSGQHRHFSVRHSDK